MNTNRSMAWLREAVGGIKYPPDRRRVEKELYAHVMQRNRDFLKEGCSEREADEKACAAMGDPVEVRRDLASIHRPFWGYAFLALRILVVGILLWTLVSGVRNGGRLTDIFRPLVNRERYSLSQWIPQSGKVRCGDYTFRLKKAAYREDLAGGEDALVLVLDTNTPDPFLGAPELLSLQLSLQDNRGKTYNFVYTAGCRELVFTCRWLVAVPGFDPGADWAVLTLQGPEGSEWLTVQLGEGRR
ncbi:MAG: hypothetical protein IKX47_07080 [Oscillospiraceae bacterium]|nr:hypothetical protein [Oscillospiraceae bacterium]